MHIVLGAHGLLPPDRLIRLRAAIVLDDFPGAGERIVNRGDLVTQHVRIGLVEINALLDNRLIVLMQWNASHLKRAGAFQATGLDDQRVVATVAVLIEPTADRIAVELWIDGHVGGKITPVSINAAVIVDVVNEDVRSLRRDYDFHRPVGRHDARHARRQTPVRRIAGLPAECLVGQIGLENLLIFRR